MASTVLAVAAAGVLAGLSTGFGSCAKSREASQSRDRWARLPALEREAYEESERAEWLRGAGDPAAAEQRLERTLERCRSGGHARCIAVMEEALGRHFQEIGVPPEALAHLGEAERVAKAAGERDLEGRALVSLGATYRDLGDKARALELQTRALQQLREIGDNRGQALALGGLGAIHRDAGERKEALEAFARAVELLSLDWRGNAQRDGFTDGGGTVAGAVALANLGTAYREVGNAEVALRYFGWALDAFRRIAHRRGEAVTLLSIGAAQRDRGDLVRAREYEEQAMALLRALRHPYGEARAAVGLARLLADRDPSRAIFHGKQAVATFEALRGQLEGLDPALQDAYASTVSGAYRRLAGLLAARARIPEAQAILSLLKGREYYEFIRRDAADAVRGEVPWTPSEAASLERYDALSDGLESIERQLVQLRRKRFLATRPRELDVQLPRGPPLTKAEQERCAELEAEESRALQGFRDFFAGLEAGLASASDREPRPGASAEFGRALAELGPGYVGVYTLVGDDAVRILLVTADRQRAYVSPLGRRELATAVLTLREALEEPSKDPRPAARSLYDAIVGPMADDLRASGARTIVWSLDGALRYVPMAALYDGEGWLVERFRSIVYPGGDPSVLSVRPHRPWTAIGLGVTRGHEGFPPLPGVEAELAAVVRDERGHGVLPGETLLDDAFTRDAMLKALARRRPVAHVASHFRFRPGDESKSFLLLGDGSHLTVGEVRMLPSVFNGLDQLTLSACESAVQGGDGAEIDGLAVLAEKRGAGAVLASLWPVADVVTPTYMREFYAQREAGLTRAEALQAVQVTMIRGELRAPAAGPGGGGWQHPFFWAPFILLGGAL